MRSFSIFTLTAERSDVTHTQLSSIIRATPPGLVFYWFVWGFVLGVFINGEEGFWDHNRFKDHSTWSSGHRSPLERCNPLVIKHDMGMEHPEVWKTISIWISILGFPLQGGIWWDENDWHPLTPHGFLVFVQLLCHFYRSVMVSPIIIWMTIWLTTTPGICVRNLFLLCSLLVVLFEKNWLGNPVPQKMMVDHDFPFSRCLSWFLPPFPLISDPEMFIRILQGALQRQLELTIWWFPQIGLHTPFIFFSVRIFHIYL